MESKTKNKTKTKLKSPKTIKKEPNLSSIKDFEKFLREHFEAAIKSTIKEQKNIGHIENILYLNITIDITRKGGI